MSIFAPAHIHREYIFKGSYNDLKYAVGIINSAKKNFIKVKRVKENSLEVSTTIPFLGLKIPMRGVYLELLMVEVRPTQIHFQIKPKLREETYFSIILVMAILYFTKKYTSDKFRFFFTPIFLLSFFSRGSLIFRFQEKNLVRNTVTQFFLKPLN